MSLIRNLSKCLALCVVLAFASLASAATLYSETVNGDLSGNRFSPTTRTLTLGDNDVFVTTQGGDQDYLTVNVPSGQALSRLLLKSYQVGGFDQTSFIGFAAGSTFPEDPISATGED